jgi:uncharacterized protein (TIGR02300 family)
MSQPIFRPILGVLLVAKPNRGLKRTCQSCTARFYDLEKDPIICPKCGVEFDPEAVLKNKRAKPAPAPRPVPVAQPVEPAEELEPIEEEVAETGDEKEDEVIEDTSELGEDDEDVAEVVDNVDEEER